MKPILFSTPMVQAILEDMKTQTRRVIKDKDITNWFDIDVDGKPIAYIDQETGDSYPPTHRAKYQPGDILWVRETWRIGAWNKDSGCIAVDYKAGNYTRREWIKVEDQNRFERYWIESTHDAIKAGIKPDANGEYHWEPGQAPTRWRPSIFMPREAARIFLRVKNVRVERLHTAIKRFRNLWDKINTKRGYGWDVNPWVWVYEFEKITKEQAVGIDGTVARVN